MLLAAVKAIAKAANPLKAFHVEFEFTDHSVQYSMVCLCALEIYSIPISPALNITKKYEEKCCSDSVFLKIGGGNENKERKRISAHKAGSKDSCTAESAGARIKYSLSDKRFQVSCLIMQKHSQSPCSHSRARLHCAWASEEKQ